MAAAILLCAPPPALAQQQHVGQYSQEELVKGARIYTTNCGFCHGSQGDAVAGVDLRMGRFRRAVSNEDLERVIRAGVPASGMPPSKIDAGEIAAVIAFIRAGMNTNAPTLLVKVGDRERGRALVHGKGDCLSCHRIRDEGGRSGPDLSEVASSRSPAFLHMSLIDPSTSMLPLNRPIRAMTRDGKVVTGRRLNEDTYTVQLADPEGRLVSLTKSDLREYRVLTTSPMPSYRDKLTEEEIADVLAYLLSLKGSSFR